ncbi:7-methylguanosine phosphate-specific 5'-nucleotidase A-like [Xenia sp. Carnegie-2017]|uniref:7-methylguanosine phosphate-specific 5'-nucleotidase A-like n=1 Tax=Xenia sp. Carnegie-2017 TaxID=2897299 RepID=UPI001F041A33|nr:7-methylguanosine phosphate-specific 5'-nucleotidase A-like [Xenia sp. Carnegie-2017]XP_046859857.1 7-methylguanosine phosphate-specific 5'-nucleotidase A-like [Xenia sp. Carnegie-2017]
MLAIGAAATVGAFVAYRGFSYFRRRQEHLINSIVNDIMNEMGKAGTVLIRDQVGVREKLKSLIAGGAKNMQGIFDFDGTITRGVYQGERAQTSFAVVGTSDLLPDYVLQKEKELREKYYPVERSNETKPEEKSKAMEIWWKEIFDVFKNAGLKKQMIPEMVKNGTSVLREGAVYFLKRLHDEKIPVLFFSAGIGEVLHEVFRQQAADSKNGNFFDNVAIISNEIIWDDEGNMTGVDEIIHSCNKGLFAQSLHFKNLVKGRHNVLLMGDNVGDAEIIDSVDDIETCLKIGFLNDNVNELRNDFERHYDIVIADTESMTLVLVILMKILDGK